MQKNQSKIVKGDENSKFFHGMINSKRKKSRINGITINGSWIEDSIRNKNHIFNFYCEKFDEAKPIRPPFLTIFLKP